MRGVCYLFGGNLKRIATFGTQCFVHFSWHVRYLGCPLLGGFTAFFFKGWLLFNVFYYFFMSENKFFAKFMGNSRNLKVKNAIFSWYYFYISKNIQGDFQICISVALNKSFWAHFWNILPYKLQNKKIFPKQFYTISGL